MSTLAEKIATGAGRLEIHLTAEHIDQLVSYGTLIQKWNRATRLVGNDRDDAVALQILDSLAILRLNLPQSPTLDVGSGAGFPGIPMAIVRSHIPMELLESRERRAAFLSEAKRILGLSNVSVVCERLENQSYSSSILAVAKALAPPPEFLRMVDQSGLKQAIVMGNQKTVASTAGIGWIEIDRDVVPLQFTHEHVNVLLQKEDVPQGNPKSVS